MGFVVPTAFLTSDPFGVGQMSGFDYNQFLKEFDFVASIPGASRVSQPKAVEPVISRVGQNAGRLRLIQSKA